MRYMQNHINQMADSISRLNRNIIISKKMTPHIRAGVMPIESDYLLLETILKNQKSEEILITHCEDKLRIRKSLEDIVYAGLPVIEAFNHNKVRSTDMFKHAVFVAPFGAKKLEKINYVVPYYGIEKISSFINRYSNDTASIVINPNLCGEDRTYSIFSNEKFDLIGFSTVPLTLMNDARLISRCSLMQKSAIKIMGGYCIEDYDIDQLFNCFDLDFVILGAGEEITLTILNNLSDLESTIPTIKGIAYKRDNNIHLQKNQNTKRRYVCYNPDLELPLKNKDLFHLRSYEEANLSLNHVYLAPEEQLTTNPLRLKLSDFCKGRCKWCAAPRKQLYFTEIDEIIREISSTKNYEGIHFEDNDLCFDRDKVIRLCDAIIKNQYEHIPKMGKSRVDSVDSDILSALAKAGFKKFGYGVESFSQIILDKLNKDVTVEQINYALNETFKVGITPVMNLILFSPWETEESLLATSDNALYYAERGAYLNSAVGMNATYGSDIIKTNPELINHEDIFYEGMKNIFKNPISLKCINPGMEMLLNYVLSERESYKNKIKDRKIRSFSSHFNSLCALKIIYEAFGLNSSAVEKLIIKSYQR